MRGLEMHVKLGAKVEAGQPLVTLFAEDEARFAEPEQLLTEALTIGDAPVVAPPLVREIISADNKNKFSEAAAAPIGEREAGVKASEKRAKDERKARWKRARGERKASEKRSEGRAKSEIKTRRKASWKAERTRARGGGNPASGAFFR